MHPWLGVGKRIEYAMALIGIVAFLGGGFVLTRSAPIEIRWIVWILTASLVFPICLAGLLYGRWVRQRDSTTPSPTNQTQTLGRLRTRIKLYLVLAIVTTVSATEQAKAFLGWPLFAANGHIFFWNFSLLAVLIALLELNERRKRRTARTGGRP